MNSIHPIHLILRSRCGYQKYFTRARSDRLERTRAEQQSKLVLDREQVRQFARFARDIWCYLNEISETKETFDPPGGGARTGITRTKKKNRKTNQYYLGSR
jgi:hypothetical protein